MARVLSWLRRRLFWLFAPPFLLSPSSLGRCFCRRRHRREASQIVFVDAAAAAAAAVAVPPQWEKAPISARKRVIDERRSVDRGCMERRAKKGKLAVQTGPLLRLPGSLDPVENLKDRK